MMKLHKTISILLLTICILTAFTSLLVGAACLPNEPCSLDGKVFVKKWVGAGVSTVKNIVIKDKASGSVLGSWGLVPPSGVTQVNTIHGAYVIVLWEDWRGQRSEEFGPIQCVNDTHYETNTIPPPPPPPKSSWED